MNETKHLPRIAYHDRRTDMPCRPRIVHLVEAFDLIGGPPVLVRQIIHSPLADRYEFAVISYAIRSIDLRSLLRLKALLKDLRPDLVHVHGLKPDGFHAVLAARLARVRRIVTVIHSSTELSVSEYVSWGARIRRWFVCHILEATTLLMSHAVYTVGNHIRTYRRIRRWSGSRLRKTIYNCIQIPSVTQTRTEIRMSLGFNLDDTLILFVGRICKNKGLMELADAMERVVNESDLAHVKLVVAGSGAGSEYDAIKARFAGMEHSRRVTFLGARSDVFNLHKMADLFVLPSIFKENLSFSLLEAIAAGTPVIATDYGGNNEVVVNRQTGLLVPHGDAVALAAAIVELCRNDKLRYTLGQAGQEHARKVFPVNKMLDETETLYQDLL